MLASKARITQSRQAQIVRGAVVGVAGAVGIAGQVEPLAGHVLAVAVVGQQPVDEPLDGVGRRVGHEGIDLFRRRRQAGRGRGPAGGRA